MFKTSATSLRASTAILLLFAPGAALAQVPSPPSAASVDRVASPPATTAGAQATARSPTVGGAQAAPAGTEVGEVIVTAQRRDESLSKTPVAVDVVSANTLAKAQVTSQQDLRTVAPGLQIRSAVNSNQLNYAVRGQSQDPLTDTTPGVVPYINEVQIGGTAGASAFYDLQSVQVLKGPQGTLFGRSATGGAVLFSTTKPAKQLGGYISVTEGDYGLQKYEGAFNTPIVDDKLLFRVAAVYQTREGFQTNLYPDAGTEGGYERYGVRPSLTANIGDHIHNELVVDYLHSNGSSTEGVISGLVPFTGTGTPYIPIQALYAGTATPVAQATGIGTVQAFLPPAYSSFVPPFYNGYFAQNGHPAGGISQVLADQNARGPYVVDIDGNNKFRSENVVVTNATTFDINPDTHIKNIFGYANLRVFNASDTDGTPYGISESSMIGQPLQGAFEDTRQVSEEIQLAGTQLADRLTYVTGFYFNDQSLRRSTHSGFFDILLGGQAQDNNIVLTSKTFAGYAQGTYKINDSGLAVTGGIRYTDEDVGKITDPTDSFRVASPVAPAGYSYDQSKVYEKLSWQVGLQDQFDSSTLLYIVSRRAYKSGGFNGTVSPKNGGADTAGDAFGAERVTDIEGGAKFKGRALDMPVRASIALFNDWIDDSQRLAFTLVGANPASLTVNVPEGTTYGAEIEAAVDPLRWLTIGTSLNYTHARFSTDPVFVNGITQNFDQVPDTPEFSGSIYAEATFSVASDINLIVHGDGYRQTRTFETPRSADDDGAVINGYNLANFRIGLEDTKLGLSLTANVRNAFNKVYYVGGLATGEIFQINTLVPGEPRTFTVEARYHF